jgi:hypothetical protein
MTRKKKRGRNCYFCYIFHHSPTDFGEYTRRQLSDLEYEEEIRVCVATSKRVFRKTEIVGCKYYNDNWVALPRLPSKMRSAKERLTRYLLDQAKHEAAQYAGKESGECQEILVRRKR